MAEDTKDRDSDIDLYCDFEEIENDSKANEENSNANGLPVPDISTLFSENECMILFSEDGKKTKIKIKGQADCDEDTGNNQSAVNDLDLFTDVVTEKFVQAKQEKLQRETLISHNIELKKLNSQLEANINLLTKKNRTLMRNICALYKTAKEEISRKDALIADLREKNDGMIFRRKRRFGAGSGPASKYSKFQDGDNAVAADAQKLNGKNSELKGNSHGVTDSYADVQATVEECNSNNFRNPGQSSDVSCLSFLGNTHKHNSERRKKLPKAFQDPEKLSHHRHLSHKVQGKRKRYKMASNNSRGTSGIDDSDEYLVSDDNNDSDYPVKGEYEEDYECYSSSKYIDLDKHDNFHGFFQTDGCALDSSNVGKLHSREEELSASHVPEALKGDSLKLFSYQRKPVPIAVKKKVLGYAKSPKKVVIGKK